MENYHAQKHQAPADRKRGLVLANVTPLIPTAALVIKSRTTSIASPLIW
jgi:hypothetical protein